MQTTYTSVLARRIRIDDDFATLPYEAGWATEAVFFVQAEGEHPKLELAVEVSPDGINWIRRGRPGRTGRRGRDRGDPGDDLRQLAASHGSRVDTGERISRILIHVNLKG